MMTLTALLAVRWRSFVNALTRTHGRERVRAWIAPIWVAVVAVSVTWAASQLFQPLFEPAYPTANVRYVAERLPAFALMGTFGMLVLSAVTVSLHALYVNQEMQLLLTAPIRPREVFVAKFVDIALANATLFAMLGFPVVAAYAHARGLLSAEYALRATVALTSFCVLPTAIGAVCAILMMRALPANRMRDIIGALGLTGLAIGYVALSLAARRMHEPAVAVGTARAMMDLLSSPTVSRGPWAWAGSVLATPPGYPEAYEPLLWLALTAVVSVVAGAAAASHLHMRGWAGAQDAAGQMPVQVRNGALWENLLWWLPGPHRAFLLKDMRSLGRDLRQLSLLLMPAAVVVVLLLNIGSDPATHAAPRALLSLALLPVLGMIALRIASSAFVGETTGLLVALASPAGARNILVGKLYYTALLSCIMAVAATAGYGLVYRMDFGEWVSSLALAIIGTIALSGIGVGMGARFLDMRPDGARASLTGSARLLTLGLQLAYSILVAAITVPAWVLVHQAGLPSAVVFGAAGIAFAALSVAATVVPILIGASRLMRLDS